MPIKVDQYLCMVCGACLSVCPYYAIDLVDDKVRINKGCTECGNCLHTCPVGAIREV